MNALACCSTVNWPGVTTSAWCDYLRTPRLLEQLRISHRDGSLGRTQQQLAKVDVLVLDDWALAPLKEGARHDPLEVINDRAGNRSTILTSQLPLEHQHGWINDPTLADTIIDRLVHNPYPGFSPALATDGPL